MSTVFLGALAFFAVASMTLMVTSFATPEWARNNSTGFSTGLNSYCNFTQCYGYGKDDKYGAFFATGFFIWMAMILLFGNVVFHSTMTFYSCKDDLETKRNAKASLIAFGITGLPGVISMTIFSIAYPTPTFTYGYSYFLGWSSCCINYACSLLSLAVVCCLGFYSEKTPSVDVESNIYWLKHKEINDL